MTQSLKTEATPLLSDAPAAPPEVRKSQPDWHADAPPAELALPSHIPALDGVRGIAVLLVLFCHATQRPFGEGSDAAFVGALDKGILSLARISWTGVDLFFVLSGFLITGILFDAKGKDHYFRNFYARRTVRIFPLYYVCLLLFLVIFPLMPAWFNFTASGEQRWGHLYSAQPWYWFYLSNYSQFWTEQHNLTSDHIIHVSWSLAIEEQFYICWPLVCFLCTRRTLLKVCAGMFFGSMLLRTVLWWRGYDWLAMGYTPCRVDGLAVGAAIALVARGRSGIASLIKPAKIVGPIAALAIAVMIGAVYALGYRRGMSRSPGYIVIGTALFALMYGSMLVLAAAALKGTLTARFFSHPLLRTYGKYSYAVYLLHMPIIIVLAEKVFHPGSLKIGRTMLPGLLLFYLLSWSLALGAAWVSWNILEKHFLKLKDLFPMEGGHAKPAPLATTASPASAGRDP